MALPNFTQPVYGQDTLSSGQGTVAQPQRQSKPLPLQTQSNSLRMGLDNVQRRAQEQAGRMLPRFNNGNPRGANNMGPQYRVEPDLSGTNPGGSFNVPTFNRDDLVVGRQGGYPSPGTDPSYYGGQSPAAGRYRPPTMDVMGRWQDTGGYNYNLPNAFGSYPGYGQGGPGSGSRGPGYSSMFGGSGNPQQFQQMLQQLMAYLQGGGG